MANGRCRPYIVHGPNHGLATIENPTNACKRQHSLVNPMQMDEIGLAELTRPRDIETRIGNIQLEKMLAREAQMPEDAPALPQEMPSRPHRRAQTHYRQAVGLFVANEHLSLHAIVVQRLHQAVGS